MSSSSRPEPAALVQKVPGLDPDEMDRVLNQTFQRYASSSIKRTGNGVAIVWFRNDLRVLDNEALYKAWLSSQQVLPVYCVDPRLFGSTYHFGFPKTGALRAQFLVESLDDLRKNLMKWGLNLLIQHGKPEEVLPSLAETYGAHTVEWYMPKKKLAVRSCVSKDWSAKSVEAKCTVRGCIRMPASLGPTPTIGDWGCVFSLDQFGLQHQNISLGMKFVGGESAALGRLNEYFWKKAREIYKCYLVINALETLQSVLLKGIVRIDMEGLLQVSIRKIREFSFPFRYPLIDANMKELSTTGFMSNRGRQIVCSFLVRDMGIDWRMGAEWFETCLLDYDPCSNYGNWTYGAGVGNDPREDRYFSIPKQVSTLLHCFLYSLLNTSKYLRNALKPLQAQNYDPEGEYVAYWLPQLKSLPKEKRHFPGMAYIKQVVPLKFGNAGKYQNHGKASTARGTNFGGRQTKGSRR
ncbi:hypothetical protein ACLB2K_014646 [Fragaria x ananassa]